MRFTRVVFVVSLVALVVVPAALALRFTDESYTPAVGVTGQAYSWSFTGAGGCGPALPYQYSAINGAPPPGLTLDKSGLVHGVPTQAGEYSFWVELSDENPPSANWCRPSTAQRQFTFKIVPGLNIVQNSLSPKITFLSQPYSFQLTTDNTGAAVTWSVIEGALPAGLTLNPSTGQISGSPTATGDFTFKIKVAAGSSSDAETYTLSVVPKLEISPPVKGVGEVGITLQLSPHATGGKPGYAWSLGDGTTLPAGLTIDPATGAISGKPSAAGKSSVKLVVTDTLALTSTLDVPFTVAPRLLLTRKPLADAKVGVEYKIVFKARGGVVPRRWVMLGGRPGVLPPGMKLNARTGELSGTPTKPGTYRLRIQVADKLGAHSSAGFVVTVGA